MPFDSISAATSVATDRREGVERPRGHVALASDDDPEEEAGLDDERRGQEAHEADRDSPVEASIPGAFGHPPPLDSRAGRGQVPAPDWSRYRSAACSPHPTA